MAEKEGGRYVYEPYQPLTSKQQNNGTNTAKRCDAASSLKPGTSSSTSSKNASGGSGGGSGGGVVGGGGSSAGGENKKRCCNCMGPKATSFWVSLLTNLGICTLLFGYTLLGSFIFLAIEGGASTMHQRTLASTNRNRLMPARTIDNVTFSDVAVSEATEARQRTVENIWDITVSLNILYRENWTR